MPRRKINQIQFQQPTKFHNITREKQCVLHNLQKCQDIVINLQTKAEQWYSEIGNIILMSSQNTWQTPNFMLRCLNVYPKFIFKTGDYRK